MVSKGMSEGSEAIASASISAPEPLDRRAWHRRLLLEMSYFTTNIAGFVSSVRASERKIV